MDVHVLILGEGTSGLGCLTLTLSLSLKPVPPRQKYFV